jgi:uracil-DNA glycosylase family 4
VREIAKKLLGRKTSEKEHGTFPLGGLSALFRFMSSSDSEEIEDYPSDGEDDRALFDALFQKHRAQWTPVGTTAMERGDALDVLDKQIRELKEHHAFSEGGPIPGSGDPCPDVLFLMHNPLWADKRHGEPFHEEANLLEEELQKETRGASLRTYYMYALPFVWNPRDDVPLEYLTAFLPYAARRMDILRPRLVVCLGDRTASHLLCYFGRDPKNKSVERTYAKQKKWLDTKTNAKGKKETDRARYNTAEGLEFVKTTHPPTGACTVVLSPTVYETQERMKKVKKIVDGEEQVDSVPYHPSALNLERWKQAWQVAGIVARDMLPKVKIRNDNVLDRELPRKRAIDILMKRTSEKPAHVQ